MEPTLKDTQKYLMKKISKYTAKIHYMMVILDIISQIIEQDEEEEQQFKMEQPKLIRSRNIEVFSDSSDDDSIGTVGSKDIELIDENSDEE
jgi:hypothetical protein